MHEKELYKLTRLQRGIVAYIYEEYLGDPWCRLEHYAQRAVSVHGAIISGSSAPHSCRMASSVEQVTVIYDWTEHASIHVLAMH